MAKRDLTVTIRGNHADFDRAMKAAQSGASEFRRELRRLNQEHRQLAKKDKLNLTVGVQDVARATNMMGLLGAAIGGVGAAAPIAVGGVAAIGAAGTMGAAGIGTLITAFSGVGDGVKALEEGGAAAAEQLHGMSAEARSLALAIHNDIKPALRGIKDDIQAATLPSMEQSLDNLIQLAPLVSDRLSETGAVIGTLAVRGSEMVTSGPWRRDFSTIMESNNRSLADFGDAGLSTADAFRTLVVEGGPLLEQLADFTATSAAAFNEFIQGRRATGELAEFMAMARDRAAELWDAFVQVAGGAFELAQALAPVFDIILDIVGGLATFVGFLAETSPLLVQAATVAGIAYAAFIGLGRAISGMSVAFGQAKSGYDTLIGGIRSSAVPTGGVDGATKSVGGLRGAMSGAVGFLGGPWGVAVTGVVAGLGLWTAHSQKTKAEQEALEQASRGVAQALLEQNGVITAQVREKAAAALQEQGLLESARELGVQLPQLTDAYLGQGNAADQLRAHLRGVIDANYEQVGGGRAAHMALNEEGVAAKLLLEDFNGLTGALGSTAFEQRLLADAARDTSAAQAESDPAMEAYKVALGGLSTAAGDADTAVDNLKEAILGLTDQEFTLQEANQAVNDSLRGLGGPEGAFALARIEAGAMGQALVDNAGNINTNTAAGSALQDEMMGLREAFAQEYAAIVQQQTALGVGLPEAHRIAQGATQGTRDRFVDAAEAAGFSREEVQRLVDRYMTMPPPPPIDVTANTAPAQTAIDNFMARYGQLDGTITYQMSGPAIGGFRPGTSGLARGAILHPMARGGLLGMAGGGGLTPMPGGVADIVDPNTWRVIGDRMRGKESYIPHDRSPRSLAILEQTARALGFQLAPLARGGILGMAVGGALAPGAAGSVSGIPGMPGIPMDPDMVEELAGSVQKLTEQALAPLSTELTGVTVPALQLVQQHAGTDSVDAITALGETLPPLTDATVTSGQTMQATWAQNAATVLGTSQQQRDTWAGDTAAVTGTQVAQTGQYQLLQANLGAATVGMTGSVTAMQGAHNASWSDMAAQSGANIATITGPQFASLHAGLTAVEQHATNTADWWGGQLGRLPVLTGTPVRALLTGPMNAGLVPAWNAIDRFFALGKVMGPVPIGFARGTEDHRAQIAHGTQPRIWNEPETGGEAYIPLAASKRGRSTEILSNVAGEFGYALEPRYFADGGLWRQMQAIVQRGVPGARISSTYRAGAAGYHGSGRAIDIGSPEAASNRWLAANFPNSSELIYTPGINLLNGRPFRYSPATRADHFDHTHWAMANAAMLGGQPGAAALPFFDIGPMIEGYFAETRRMIAGIIPAHGPGNVPVAATKFGTDAVDGAVRHATDRMMVSIGPGGGAGVERWRGVGLRALAIAGQPASEIGRLLMQMNSESGGNPTAVNRNDINWINGTPSVGLMQVIGPTYRSHRHPQFDTGPYLYGTSTNPLSNILASTRYTLSRYGSLARGWRGVGYGDGGVAAEDGPAYLHAGERVLPPRQTEALDRILEVLTTKRGMSFAGMAAVGGAAATVIHRHYQLTVYDAGNTRVDLETQFARLEMRAGI